MIELRDRKRWDLFTRTELLWIDIRIIIIGIIIIIAIIRIVVLLIVPIVIPLRLSRTSRLSIWCLLRVHILTISIITRLHLRSISGVLCRSINFECIWIRRWHREIAG